MEEIPEVGWGFLFSSEIHEVDCLLLADWRDTKYPCNLIFAFFPFYYLSRQFHALFLFLYLFFSNIFNSLNILPFIFALYLYPPHNCSFSFIVSLKNRTQSICSGETEGNISYLEVRTNTPEGANKQFL